mmetsp:Transcript_7109/g.14523  ORF Transcript_7109/g.14523 Transcript_7109/m.14523 type:complete len:209 (+) Transcript_7109:547-1173(+)
MFLLGTSSFRSQALAGSKMWISQALLCILKISSSKLKSPAHPKEYMRQLATTPLPTPLAPPTSCFPSKASRRGLQTCFVSPFWSRFGTISFSGQSKFGIMFFSFHRSGLLTFSIGFCGLAYQLVEMVFRRMVSHSLLGMLFKSPKVWAFAVPMGSTVAVLLLLRSNCCVSSCLASRTIPVDKGSPKPRSSRVEMDWKMPRMLPDRQIL